MARNFRFWNTQIAIALSLTSCLLIADKAACAEDFAGETKAGMAALDFEKYAEAETHLKKAMKAATLAGGAKYGDYSTALVNLGILYARQKQVSQADGYYREALANYQKAYGDNSLESAKVFVLLGDLYRKAGKYVGAKEFFEKAKKVREVAAPDHPDLADTLAGLAECDAKTGAKDEAVALMQKVISIREKVYGKSSPKVVKSRLMLASLYEEIGKPRMAAPAYEAVVSMAGGDDPKAATALERLGELYETRLKYDKADDCFKRALKIREAHPGKQNEDLKKCVKSYAAFLKSQNRPDEAKKVEAKLSVSSSTPSSAPGSKPAAK